MALELKLAKQGDVTPKLTLNLAKPASFRVELYWDSEQDLDAHALLVSKGKVTSLDHILSTYNCKKTNAQGVLPALPDGSFATPEGGLFHSPDVLTGNVAGSDVDEFIQVDGSKIPADVDEIPIFVTIHPPGSAKFGQVKEAGIRIKSGETVLADYKLSNQFGEFNAVQMGSLVLGDKGWEFATVGSGFNGDFNAILGSFS